MAALAILCLTVGFGGVAVAYAENGGCEVGGFVPDGAGWQPCSAINPSLVWGGVLAVVGMLLAGLAAATAAIATAIAGASNTSD